MDTFDSTKRITQQTYNNNVSDGLLIDKKINDLSSIPLDIPYFQNLQKLEDTGDVSTSLGETDKFYFQTFSLEVQNVDENFLMPVCYLCAYANSFEIEEKYLPFIDWQKGFSSAKDNQIVATHEFEYDDWENSFDVYGDSDLIWKGANPPQILPTNSVTGNITHNYYTITQDRIDDGSVSITHTKPHWLTDIYWTTGITQYRVINASLYGFLSKDYDTSASPCGGHTDYYNLYGTMWSSSYQSIGNFVSVNGNSLTVTGRELHSYYQLVGPTCTQFLDTTYNVTKTFNLTDLSTISVYGKRQRWNGSAWISDPSNGRTKFYDITTSKISSFSATQEDYLVYWDTYKTCLFIIPLVNGSSPSPSPTNLPTWVATPTGLPYTQISYQVEAKKFSDRLGAKPKHFHYIIQTNGSMDPFYIRLSKSSDTKQKWSIRFNFGALRLSEATVSQNLSFPLWNDVYIHNGFDTSYILGSTSHVVDTKQRWWPALEPIYAKVVGTARNPLYFKKTQTFTKEAV